MAISKDPTFNNNSATTLSKSATALNIAGTGSTPNIFLSPADQIVAVGDTLTMDVMLQYSLAINFFQVVLTLNDDSFSIVDQSSETGSQPFVDLGNVFAGSTEIENTYLSSARQMRFSKSNFAGDEVGVSGRAEPVARFQLVATDGLEAAPDVVFSGGDTGTVLGLFGKGDPLDDGEGLSLLDPELTRISRGQISATVELEGRTSPLGDDDHTTMLDVHLRLPGSTEDIADAIFLAANDDIAGTTDTLEVQTNAAGALALISVPAGRYVLTVKDTSHVSGRTDTIEVRNGETVTISSANNNGFFGSDLRGDPTDLLESSGTLLIAGDVSEDNEINEDDVNLIIAAWGTAASADNFAQADINNDQDVGAADLIVTTSNFGNSEGFGAPPVYKPARLEDSNAQAKVELVAVQGGIPEPGSQVEVALAARDLAALAGFEVELRFDPQRLQLVPGGVRRGDVFLSSPRGAVFETDTRSGRLRLIGARIGKGWAASGDRTLARLRFNVVGVDGLGAVEAVEGVLLDPLYRHQAVTAPVLAVVPRQAQLGANYPNPFNPETTIPFALSAAGEVQLEIYNVLGQKVNTLLSGPLAAGFHTAVWNGRDLAGRPVASGVYFYRLHSKDFMRTDKMVLLR